jgi:hypothetical protein
MTEIETTTSPGPRRPRRASELKFAKPKVSHADLEARVVRASGVEDTDFLGSFIQQVVAAGELGHPSDDLEVNFLLSAIEDILLSNPSNRGAAKSMLAAQYALVHVQIMRLTRCLTRITPDPVLLDIYGRLVNSLARTSVAQYEALTRGNSSVTVGHVSVNEGGRAIVGSVTQNQGEPATQKTAPSQPLLTDAKEVLMPIVEDGLEPVSIPASRAQENSRTPRKR